MLVITIRFKVRPEWCDRWMGMVEEFTRETRAEQGNLWFHWARDVDDPTVFVLLEGHQESSVEEHLRSPLIPRIQREWPQALVETPRLIKAVVPGTEWAPMDLLPVPALADHG
ncbi:putative quinol monooxygenase [Umezawaea sp. Da 62-37]|uniref:putative quinol monooxygenase n=1 Tax=Umezawaea sp. Da 62-37 TaxID=3075927 RepID=UPI0028F70929|nr:putative quinol monooxygenase [Umezawaea sp. Da 62-37]WNV86862.1 putative quinol monooxygenase [Umezawaea sp. Da 62-37]